MSALLELKEAGDKLLATRGKLNGLMEKKDDKGKLKWEPEDFDAFEALNKQVNDDHDEFKKWEEIADADRKNRGEIEYLNRAADSNPVGDGRGGMSGREPRKKSVGQMTVESQAYKKYVEGSFSGVGRFDLNDYGSLDFKTTMTSSAGYLPFVTRGPDIVPFALRRPMVQDLMPSHNITERGIEYMEETTLTRNAAPVAEAATKPESARVFTPRQVYAEVIAALLPITEQQLADAPFLMGYINETLGMEIELAEEDALLGGNGTSPQIQGYLTKTGIQVQAKGADPTITAFFKGLTKIRYTGFAEPSAAVWHPTDWQNVVTVQDSTGRYIFGDPTAIDINRLWGVPAVVTPAMTLGTILEGDFRRYSYIVRRQGLRIDMGWINDNFAKNIKTVRAETRMGLAIRRAAAFCTVTGV